MKKYRIVRVERYKQPLVWDVERRDCLSGWVSMTSLWLSSVEEAEEFIKEQKEKDKYPIVTVEKYL